MSKIGVFICHCGENISATVDCEKVAEAAKEMEGVAYAIDYKYMCSDPGQTLIKNGEEVKEILSQSVERERIARRVSTRENMIDVSDDDDWN